MKHALALASLLALCAPAAHAQITFTGRIEKAFLPSICQEETHILVCNGARLKSSTLNLDPFIGSNVKLFAVARGVTCTIYDVTAVGPPTATLDFCGNPVPGCPVRFRVGPSGVIGQYWLFMSFGSAFLPLGTTAGTQLIANPVFLIAMGPTSGPPNDVVDLVVPPDPVFTGLSLWFQGIRQDVGPIGPPELTNAICLTILGPSPPCIQPGC